MRQANLPGMDMENINMRPAYACEGAHVTLHSSFGLFSVLFQQQNETPSGTPCWADPTKALGLRTFDIQPLGSLVLHHAGPIEPRRAWSICCYLETMITPSCHFILGRPSMKEVGVHACDSAG